MALTEDIQTNMEETMATLEPEENLVSQNVIYVLETEGWLYVIKSVPAQVSTETGKQLFSPETVRVLKTPVFEFAA